MSNLSVYTNLGASNHSLGIREGNDFYATEPKAAELLLDVVPELNNIWECACGQGHLAKVFDSVGKLGKAKDIIKNYGAYCSFYAGDSNPSTLFSGVKSQLSIIILSKNFKNSFSTNYVRWFEDYRTVLFNNITYTKTSLNNEYFKIGHNIEANILQKVASDKKNLLSYFIPNGEHKFYYRSCN